MSGDYLRLVVQILPTTLDTVVLLEGSVGFLNYVDGADMDLTIAETSGQKAFSYTATGLSPEEYTAMYLGINSEHDLEVMSTSTTTETFDLRIKKETLTSGETVTVDDVSIPGSTTQEIDVKNWSDLTKSKVYNGDTAVQTKKVRDISMPRIRSISPKKVTKSSVKKKRRKNYKFTIKGNNFKKKSKVKFGKKKAKKVIFKSKKKIVAVFNLKKLKKKQYTVTVTNPKKKKVRKERAVRIK